MPNKYTTALYQLLPQGLSWQFDVDSNSYKLIDGLAVDFNRLGTLIDDIGNDLTPQTSVSKINDWLKLLGLPTYTIRNLHLTDKQKVAKLLFADDGNQSLPKFYQIAEELGFKNIKLYGLDANYRYSGTSLKNKRFDAFFVIFDMSNATYTTKKAKIGSKCGTKLHYRIADDNHLVDSLLFIFNRRNLANISVVSNYYKQMDIF